MMIKDQIIEDPVSGLTIQFETMPDGEQKLRLFGEALPFGNRELSFDQDGVLIARGISTTGRCRPTWALKVESHQ